MNTTPISGPIPAASQAVWTAHWRGPLDSTLLQGCALAVHLSSTLSQHLLFPLFISPICLKPCWQRAETHSALQRVSDMVGRSTCGRCKKAPQRCPCPNPQKTVIMFPTMVKGTLRCYYAQTLEMGGLFWIIRVGSS